MKHIYWMLNWMFGVLFLLAGAALSISSFRAGLCLVTAAALLLPPVRSLVYSKTNQALPVKFRAISIVALVLGYCFFLTRTTDEKYQKLLHENTAKETQLRQQKQQQNIDYFNTNREQIISSAKKALLEKDYQSVISQINQYLVSSDKELEQINTQAQNELAALRKAEKTKQLLDELKGGSSNEYEKNRNLYQQLLRLHPDNQSYKTKLSFYGGKVEEEKQKQIAADERKKKIKSQFSGWNGSHRNLEEVIKASMNDPRSYEHVETVYWDQGDHLVVRTTFRGKNAFGGVVKNGVKAKVSLDGEILEMLDRR